MGGGILTSFCPQNSMCHIPRGLNPVHIHPVSLINSTLINICLLLVVNIPGPRAARAILNETSRLEPFQHFSPASPIAHLLSKRTSLLHSTYSSHSSQCLTSLSTLCLPLTFQLIQDVRKPLVKYAEEAGGASGCASAHLFIFIICVCWDFAHARVCLALTGSCKQVHRDMSGR